MKKVLLSLCLIAVMLSVYAVPSFAYEDDANLKSVETSSKDYQVEWKRSDKTDKYSFPYTPDMPVWTELTQAERLLACDIPDSVLAEITSNELVELVLQYPYLVDVYAYGSFSDGISIVASYCTALQKILDEDILKAYITEHDLLNQEALNAWNMIHTDIPAVGSIFLKDYINIFCTSTVSPLSIEPRGTAATVYTPNGTAVAADRDRNELDSWEISSKNSQFQKTYPSIVFVSTATNKYNCHSYAWYQQSTSNRYWINNPAAYMTDGSYTRITSGLSANDKVYYRHSSVSADHSAILLSPASMIVISKWGDGPLFRHYTYECPYMNGATLEYYRR